MLDIGDRQWLRATLALSLGSCLIYLNLYQVHPLLPLIAKTFTINALQANWTLAGCTAGLAIALLFWARLSDSYGRRVIILSTLTLALLLSFGLAFVDNFHWLLALRALQGFILAGLPASAIAYMGEEFSKRALLYSVGVYIAANSIGGIAGRILGGLFAHWFGHWQSTFFGIGLLSLSLLPLVYWLLPRQQHFVANRQTGQFILGLRLHLTNPLLLVAYLIGGLNFMIFLNQFSYLTFALAAPPFSLPTQWLGLLFLTYLAGTLASSLSGRYSQRFGTAQMLLLGIGLMAVGSLGLLVSTLSTMIIGLIICSFGFFLAHACASAWVGQHVNNHRALASSLYLVAYYLGASLGGLYLHPFWQWRQLTGLTLAIELVLMLTAALSIWLMRRQSMPPTAH